MLNYLKSLIYRLLAEFLPRHHHVGFEASDELGGLVVVLGKKVEDLGVDGV
jgi:hypothetical protein